MSLVPKVRNLGALIAVGFITFFCIPSARAEPDHSLIILSSLGTSTALEPRVSNLAPPTVEARYSFSLRTSLFLEGGLAVVVFPELVPDLRVGARFHPAQLINPKHLARDFFVRLGGHALASLSGFELGPSAEVGFAVSHERLLGLVGASVTRDLRRGRVLTEIKVGLGVSF